MRPNSRSSSPGISEAVQARNGKAAPHSSLLRDFVTRKSHTTSATMPTGMPTCMKLPRPDSLSIPLPLLVVARSASCRSFRQPVKRCRWVVSRSCLHVATCTLVNARLQGTVSLLRRSVDILSGPRVRSVQFRYWQGDSFPFSARSYTMEHCCCGHAPLLYVYDTWAFFWCLYICGDMLRKTMQLRRVHNTFTMVDRRAYRVCYA